MPDEYFLRPGAITRRFTMFISSGSDVHQERDFFESAVKAANDQYQRYRTAAAPFYLDTDRWENDAARRTTEMNAEFVRRAKASHATVVLLADEVRRGTREEIEGVLEVGDVQLSVIWMIRPGSERKAGPLKKFLREHENEIAYYKTGEPGSRDAALAVFRVINAAFADLTNPHRTEALFSEER